MADQANLDLVEQARWSMENLTAMDFEDQLIIGLDFGTTFSGIAYVFSNSTKRDVTSITDWPGAEGLTVPKIPTIITYDPNDKHVFTWGAQAASQTTHEKIEAIKLLLDPDQETPLYVPPQNTRVQLQRLGKPPLEVVADYLRAIYAHAMGRIQSKVPADYVKICQKKFVLTVPAVWSDKAKNATLMAAKQAGIYPITMIKEPEAAALYTLHYLKDKSLTAGDAFVLCDAGGGTVDLISYQITKLTPKLELKELVPGKGGLAGSINLNRRFADHVKNIVGEDEYVILRKTRGFLEAMKQFDTQIKTAFRSTDEEYFVNFPMANLKDDPANDLQSNCLNLKGDGQADLCTSVTDIQRLVDDQVNLVTVKRMEENHPKAKEIKAIFLVGGFGSSEYLKTSIQERHPNIQVIQPHDAWSAIVKGAVLSQLPEEAAITSSVATRHYGVSANDVYVPLEDLGQPIKKDMYTGVDRVKKMTWYIYQGEDLQREQKIIFPFYRSLPDNLSDSQLIFKNDLIQCETIRPAPYPKEGITRVNCTLTADLRKVPRSQFKRLTSINGSPYYDIHYDLAVVTQSAAMKFSLEIDGEEFGTVEARYD